MRHRHLNHEQWTPAAIDSALEYGDLADWRELFAAVSADRALAAEVLRVATAHPLPGSSALARWLVGEQWPELNRDCAPH